MPSASLFLYFLFSILLCYCINVYNTMSLYISVHSLESIIIGTLDKINKSVYRMSCQRYIGWEIWECHLNMSGRQ